MFGLEGSGFIISLGVTLLLCGVIAYYAKNQFSLMEHKITSMFDLVSSLAGQVNQLNKMIVENKVNNIEKEPMTISKKNENDLILVSESEYSGNESDDSDESETESENSDIHISSHDVTLNEPQNLTMGSELDNIKVVELDIDNDNDNDNDIVLNNTSQELILEPQNIELESGNNSLQNQHSDSSSSSESESDEETQVNLNENNISEIQTIDLEPIEVLKLDDGDENDNNDIEQNLDYKKLQVKVLRELVKERGLSENPSKINKKDLVKLLEA